MKSPLDTARAAALVGGQTVARYFREGVEIRNKQSYNLVSDADIHSEQAIVEVIRRDFPDHHLLAEEEHASRTDVEHLWLIDPLDGTNNFAHHIPHFAVSVAYYRDGQPWCGVIHNPLRDDWYVAERGRGATWNGQPVQVAPHQRLDQSLIGVGFYYDRGRMMEATLAALGDFFRAQVHGIRRFGTASLDLCHVAQGMYGAYFEFELSPWDFAAGRLFVEEAGGRVTTCDGAELPLAKTSLLASNGLLHDAALEIARRHLPRREPPSEPN
ncbi:MAG: inositol monophosphatase [Pirellulaceae bacterium]|nr:inositol monophosphatase [Pirellulaceae bacterium]